MKSPQWLNRAIFTCPIYYTLCTTEAMFRGKLRRLQVPRNDWPAFLATPQASATAHYFEQKRKGRTSVIVCIAPAPERDQLEVVGLLVHEAVHIWQWIAEHVGEQNPSAEFEAYAVQGIVQSLLGECRRQVHGGPR